MVILTGKKSDQDSSHGVIHKYFFLFYRSPWSNKYDPPLSDGAVPSANLRQLELQANEVFDIYRDLYFEGGVSSVYCWDLDSGFAAVVLIKKSTFSIFCFILILFFKY